MKLTKRKTLEICVQLWTWLSKHGNAGKEDWPGWKQLAGADIDEFFPCDCPCCAYFEQHEDVSIDPPACGRYCLIKWPGGDCLSGYSPFAAWDKPCTSDSERGRLAKQIVVLANAALKKLPKRNKTTQK